MKINGVRGVDWIHLAEVMDKWQAVVNAMLGFWIP
jgi:hypothetical protein